MDIRSILSIPLVSFSFAQARGAGSLGWANLSQRKPSSLLKVQGLEPFLLPVSASSALGFEVLPRL